MKRFKNFINESKKEFDFYSMQIYKIKYYLTKEHWNLILVSDYNIVGSIEFKKIDEDFRVEKILAIKGFGPLMYEIALGFIYPNYLGTLESQTKEATNVWNKFKERDDIEVKKDEYKKRYLDFKIRAKEKEDFQFKQIKDCPDFIEQKLSEFLETGKQVNVED